jgi:hypothetical protein
VKQAPFSNWLLKRYWLHNYIYNHSSADKAIKLFFHDVPFHKLRGLNTFLPFLLKIKKKWITVETRRYPKKNALTQIVYVTKRAFLKPKPLLFGKHPIERNALTKYE